MGRAKQAMEEHEENRGLTEFLHELLDQDAFSGALAGIAKQVEGKGLNSLSAKQREIVDKFVKNYEKENECKRCGNGNVVNLSDLIFISENGLCPMCENDKEKFLRD